MKKNVCVVGYGSIGPSHTTSLSKIENVNLYGICDIDCEKADRGALQYNCKAFYRFEDCLKDENIDTIHICTPHYLHYEMIEQCLAAGKEVVTEKPVTMKQEEFELLLANHKDKPIAVVMQNRTNNCVRALKEIIDTDSNLGKLLCVKGFLTWHRDASYYDHGANWRGHYRYAGGGALINQSIHTLDLMIYLCGNVKNVQATMTNKSLQGIIEVEDTVDAFLQFENGAAGIFYATNAYGKNSRPELEFEFEHASFQYRDGDLYQNGELICSDDRNYSGKDYWGSGHGRLFYDLYTNQKAFTIEDVRNTMETMFNMYASANTERK